MSDFQPKNEFEAELNRVMTTHLPDGYFFVLIAGPVVNGTAGAPKCNLYSNLDPNQTPEMLRDVAQWLQGQR